MRCKLYSFGFGLHFVYLCGVCSSSLVLSIQWSGSSRRASSRIASWFDVVGCKGNRTTHQRWQSRQQLEWRWRWFWTLSKRPMIVRLLCVLKEEKQRLKAVWIKIGRERCFNLPRSGAADAALGSIKEGSIFSFYSKMAIGLENLSDEAWMSKLIPTFRSDSNL